MAEEVGGGGCREALRGGGQEETSAEKDCENRDGSGGDYGSDCDGGRGECEEKRERGAARVCVESADGAGGYFAGSWRADLEPICEPQSAGRSREGADEVETISAGGGCEHGGPGDWVRKGTGQVANPTIQGRPVDTRPGTVETTDNQMRIAGQQGCAPSTTQAGDASGIGGQSAPNDRAHPGMELGGGDDTFKVFQGGVQHPVDTAPVWRYVVKDGLKAPGVAAVEQFQKAVEELEKAAAQKQQQRGQQKNP